MSSIQKKFVAFGEWSPDSVEFDNPNLEIAKNVLPVYGSHRPIEKRELLSEATDSDPVTGGHAHLASNILPDQRILPISGPVTYTDTDQEEWWSWDSQDLHSLDDEGASLLSSLSADDREFVFCNNLDTPEQVDGFSNWKLWLLDTPRVIPSAFGGDAPKIVVRAKGKVVGVPHTLGIQAWMQDDGTVGNIVGTETNPVQVVVTGTIPADGDWVEYEYILSDAGPLTELTDLLAADWSKLELGLRISISPGVSDGGHQGTTEDVQIGSFLADDGTDTDLFEHIAVDAVSPRAWDSYIQAWIPRDSSEQAIFALGTLAHGFANVDDIFMSFVASSDRVNTAVKYELIQVDATGEESATADDESKFVTYGEQHYRIVYTWNENELGTDQTPPDVGTTTEKTVAQADLNAPNWDDEFYIAITGIYGGNREASPAVTAYPTGPDPVGVNGITGNSSDTDTDDTNGLTWSTDTSLVPQVSLTFASRIAPAINRDDRFFTIKGTAGAIFNGNCFGETRDGVRHRLFQNPGGVGFMTIPTSGELTVPVRNNAPLDAHHNIKLFIQHTNTSTAMEINFVEYNYNGDSADFRVYEVDYDKNHIKAAIGFSHLYLEAEPDVNMNMVDRVETYVGTKTKLYQVHEGSWEDVSIAAGYGDESVDLPRVWDFTSWGDDIIAVNYADQPQRKQVQSGVPDTLFSNFITTTGGGTSGELPYARYCAVVGAQLILADINPTSYSDGFPFSIWASSILDPEKFFVADYDTQSAIFSLIAQPGAVTGIVGGEYGIVFKRNSVWRMSYVGLPVVFEFDALSIGQGTPFPRSIVPVDKDVYFWGNGGIFRVNAGSDVQRISGGRVEKLIFDDKYEEFSLKADYTSDTVFNESLVQGAYDAYTGLVWWYYRGPGDTVHKLTHFLTYNPREDRFAHGKLDGLNLTIALARGNVSFQEASINRGIQIVEYSGTVGSLTKFRSESNYAAQLKTKIMSPRAFDYQDGREIEVQAVRPIYIAQPANKFPNFKITVESAQDPNMFRGVQTKIVDNRLIDKDGWVHIRKPSLGEFHRFTVDIPTMKNVLVKEFVGLQCQIRAAGDY